MKGDERFRNSSIELTTVFLLWHQNHFKVIIPGEDSDLPFLEMIKILMSLGKFLMILFVLRKVHLKWKKIQVRI